MCVATMKNSSQSDAAMIFSVNDFGMEHLIYAIITFLLLIFLCFRLLRRKNMIDPSGLPIFISGCDTGLGNSLAVYFNSLGCDVYAGCLNPEESRHSLPESVTIVPLNICDDKCIKEAVAQVKESLQEKGKDLWGVINNAGVCVYGYFEWQTWEQCQKQVEVNLLGTMRLTRAFLPLLRKSKGRLIMVSSVNGSISYPGLSVYSATKFALEGLSHALRHELRQLHGINVILVEPGDYARLTRIMSLHEQNAQEMWNNMPQEDQEQFGDFFRTINEATMRNYGLTSPRNMENSQLLKDMRDALLNSKPGIRYISDSYGIFYKMLGLMPFTFLDWILGFIANRLIKSVEGDR